LAGTASGLAEASIWARLRRRKVVQWGLIYAAAAWTLAQGSAYLVDTFELPRRWQQAAALVLIAGLPIALTIAWFHGDRGQQHVGRVEAAMLAACVVAAGLLLWRYPYSANEKAFVGAPSPPAERVASDDARPSIAVLPFANRSDRREDEFFAGGIQDDILTQLAKIRAMRVISRTSVGKFHATTLSTREIGAQLGVNKVLEGGVQRAGGRVRVTVQLIDVASDAHLWAETYDRELSAENIFAIQSEIAEAVARALKAALTPEERAHTQQVPTHDLQAWEAYQIGRLRQANRGTKELKEAEGFLQRAIDLDPEFAAAHAALAENLILQVEMGAVEEGPATERARILVDRALRIDPQLAEAVTTQAGLAELNGDRTIAEEKYLRAIELNPNYARAPHWYSTMLSAQGRVEDALRYAEHAARLDPLSAVLQINVGGARETAGQFDAALDAFRKAVDIDPAMANARFNLGSLYAFGFGRIDQGLPWIEQAVRLDPSSIRFRNYLQFLRMQLGGSQLALANREIAQAVRQKQPGADVLQLVQHFNSGSFAEVRDVAAQMLAEWPRGGLALVALRNMYLQEGKLAEARDLYLNAYPEFAATGPLTVDADSYHPAIDCATVLSKLGGAHAKVERLLRAVDVYLSHTPRMGIDGRHATGAVVLAIRGRNAEALAELRELDREGYFYAWRYFRDYEPAFDTIRRDREFKAVFARVERRMAEQLARIESRAREASSK
jgi:TolB-like protein